MRSRRSFNNCGKEEQQNMWKFDDNLEQFWRAGGFAEPRSGIHLKLGDSGGSWLHRTPAEPWIIMCAAHSRPNRSRFVFSPHPLITKSYKRLQRQWLVIWTNTLSVFLLQNFTFNSMHYMLLCFIHLWNLLEIYGCLNFFQGKSYTIFFSVNIR